MKVGTKFVGENGVELIYVGFGTFYGPHGIKINDRHAYVLASEENSFKGFTLTTAPTAFFISKNLVNPIDVKKDLAKHPSIYNPVILLEYHNCNGFHPGCFIRNERGEVR